MNYWPILEPDSCDPQVEKKLNHFKIPLMLQNYMKHIRKNKNISLPLTQIATHSF